jgi:hypothetical protein
MGTLRRILLYFLVAVICFGIGYFAIAGYTYSEGSRTGLLIKFSKKGYVFKTWEGELNLGGMTQQGGVMVNNMWQFSVPGSDTAAINQLQTLEGKRIRLSYKEKVRSFPWQGETRYFVNKAELAE